MGAEASVQQQDYFNKLSPEQQQALQKSVNRPANTHAILSKKPSLTEHALKAIEELHKHPIKAGSEKGEALPCMELLSLPGSYYIGEWKTGKQHGKGVLMTSTGIYFEGYFNNGVAECDDGLMVFPDGSTYRGHFKNNAFNGVGIFTHRSQKAEKQGRTTYAGQWLDNKPHGRGKETFDDMSTYEGNFVKGLKEGSGVFKWAPTNKTYQGEFKNGEMEGKGRLYASNERAETNALYDGQFLQGLKVADQKTTIKTPYGTYEGRLQFGQLHDSEGKFTWNDGKVYEGGFSYGELEGSGRLLVPKWKKEDGKEWVKQGNEWNSVEGEWHRGESIKITSLTSVHQ